MGIEVQVKGAGEDEGVLGDGEETLAEGVAWDGCEVDVVDQDGATVDVEELEEG